MPDKSRALQEKRQLKKSGFDSIGIAQSRESKNAYCAMNVLLSTKPNSAWALQGVIRSRSNGAQAFERREKQQVSVAAPSERVRVILFESSFLRVLCFRKRGKQTHFPERKE